MAVAGSGRGPIKVGSGYIDVFPKLNQSKLRETRAQIEKQMGATGEKAGKLFANGLVSQMASIPKKAKAAADKAQKEIQKSAMDSKKVLSRIEAELTKTYGKEAGKRFRAAQDLEKQKRKLLEATSSETRKALQLTVKEEQAAARNAAKAWETAERERLRMIAERTRAAEKAARDEAAAQRRSQIQQREELRRTLTAARTARLADLRSQMDTHRDQLAGLRNQLQTYRRQMQDHTSAVGRSLTGLQTGWRRQGEAIERLGTNITETGRIINTSLLMPLGAVASLISTIGVKSADMRILGQMGLTAAGVSKKNSASEMHKIQQYAIDTPFSIDVMHEYQMKLIRSIAGNDDTWYNPKTKTKAANRAASKTSDIIMSIGDTMSRAGNLDPSMFQRAMYAVDRIMDMDKAPTRNINQLVQATGIPAGELAKMFGFNSAGDFWKKVGTPVAKGGGISGTDMIDNLLQQWDPGYFKLDKNGKRIKDKASGQSVINEDPHSKAGGSFGYGERMTSATISGRIQQMKERAQFELGSLFAQEDKKTGEYHYTGLGESLMGKAQGKDKNGNTVYEGGLLQEVKTLMGGQKGNAVALMQTLFEALGTFVKQIQKVSDWLEAHPEIKEAFTKVVKLAAAVAPFILAIGLATKVFGKVTKMFSSALTPLKGMFKGLRGSTRAVRQVRAGMQSRREGGSFREGYRNRRTELRGGDNRGPIARTRDRITGRDSGVNQIRNQMRDTENAINDTEEAIRRLQREIRDVNSVSIRQLVDQFEGHDNNSLTQASRNTVTQVNNVRTQVGELNRSSLSSLDREVNNLGEKFKDLESKVKSVIETVGDLNKKNLNSLKVSVDSATGTVDDLQDKIKNTTLDVGDLNKKSLSGLIDEFHKSTDACDKLHDKVKATISQVVNLNKAKLSELRKEFGTLHTKVNDVHKLVGTSKSGLHGRITNLDNKSLSKIKKSVDNLKDALKDAGDKAETLEDRLKNISNHAPGKSGSNPDSKGGSKKKKGRATGGVLSGYTPGRDVHKFYSPTAGELHLSGGEAVMRPEFTAALGEANINQLNLLARTKGIHGVRKAMRFADGGTIRRLGLDQLVEGARNFNVGENTLGAFDTMRMDSSSRNIGGTVQPGIVGAGTDGSHFIGSDMARKFEGIKNYISRDSWDILKKAPIPDGLTQAVGVIGGIVGPIAGDYLWENVWKGKGNILERGSDFLDDLFSTKTLSSIWDNAIGGVTDSAKALWKGGVSAITDPIGTVTDAVDGVWDLMAAEYQGVVDMIASVKEIYTSPMDYADQVFKDIYSTAKESMPNLEGLFDFSDSNFKSGRKPDMAKLVDKFSKPGKGSAVTRWTPQVKAALAQLGLPASALDLVLHRINVESGGNPAAINNWDSNAKAGHPSQGLMQTIPSTFAAYAGPYRSRGILDPFANIYAGLNYARSRYGSGWQLALRGNKGYATGTDGADSGWAWVGEEGPELVNFKGGETVLNHQDSMTTARKVNRGYASGTSNSGLYKAMIGSTSQLNTALTKLRDLLSKAFSADLITKSQHGSLSKWLEKENSQLSKQATKRASIATKIKEANAKLTDLKNDANQMATSIAGEATGGNPLAAALSGGNGVTPEAALSGLQDRLNAIKQFKSSLTSLSKKGYSPQILKEVASEGLVKGTEMAKALLTADSSQVKDITKTYGQIFSQSDALGQGVADQYYSAGSKATKALLAGLKSEEKELLKGISSMVSKMISELRKKLGVSKGEPVPSSVASLFTWLTGLSQPTKSTKTTKKSTKKKTKGYAIGTLSASPGLSLVGERGPELVNFRGGERVYTAKDTESLLSSGRPIYITVQEAKHETTPQAVLKGLQYYDTMYGNRL
ncbi:transglycosylase SLT domain-containing protein [Streptomyces sp. NPDC058369]|uniref:transglycosylase SLT domain-containing protein n=1 Tax=Streptomyces sp. NPDC058369 TaxID=3346462 RepID=UPI0036631DC8